MRKVAIIQARTGSTRLPRKVLADIGGRTMLERVVTRVRASELLDDVIVATTDKPPDDDVVALCERRGFAVFRGSEFDVLARYARAAEVFDADVVARITADCPLIDATVVDRVLREFLVADVDYASNTLVRSYPRGLDTEVFRREVLHTCEREAGTDHERIHVTPFIYQHPEMFRLLSIEHEADMSRHRWTVDVQADLDLVRATYAALGNDVSFHFADVLELMVRRPDLAQINAHVAQKDLLEG